MNRLYRVWMAGCLFFVCWPVLLAAAGERSDPHSSKIETDGEEELILPVENPASEEISDTEISSSEETPKEPPSKKKRRFKDGFSFGTYGRIQASWNAHEEPGDDSNVVSHGARLMEGPYAEFDFKYTVHTDDGFGVRVLATLAFFDEVFHYTGDATQGIAMRNLYAEARHFIPGVDLRLWVGSRMYRGDDIYLLDFWPLDNLNTLGGGLQWNGYGLQLKWHVGVNRLRNEYQFRTLSVPTTFGADEITLVNRQRLISSFKAEYLARDISGDFSMKAALYGEIHHLPDGEYRYSAEDSEYLETYALDAEEGDVTEMPQDRGGVVGAQLGFWGFGNGSHLNLFLRYAWDLAAYGEWGVPWGVSLDRTAKGAKEAVGAFSFNWESHWFGVMAGGYGRYFEDADGDQEDLDDYWEGIAVVRPGIFITRHIHQLFEVSHQWKRPNGLTSDTDKLLIPQVWQLSVMPAISFDRGMYRRPQFRFVYTASHLNGAALELFPAWDARRDASWQHYFGVQVEWWLDSSSYQ